MELLWLTDFSQKLRGEMLCIQSVIKWTPETDEKIFQAFYHTLLMPFNLNKKYYRSNKNKQKRKKIQITLKKK